MNHSYAPRVETPRAMAFVSYLAFSLIFSCDADAANLPTTAQFVQQRSQLQALVDRMLYCTTTNQIKSPCKQKLISLFNVTRSLVTAEQTTVMHRAIILHNRVAKALDTALTNCQNVSMLECLAKELEKSSELKFLPDSIWTFKETNTLINAINQRLNSWGTTWFQRSTRNINQLMQEYKIDVAAKRIAPYAILGFTFLYINEAGKVESINLPGIPTIKRMIGTCPKSPKGQEIQGLDTFQRTFNPAALFLTTVVMGDFKQAVNWSGNKLAATWAWLQGKNYCTSPLFQSKLRFADFAGNTAAKEQLQTLARYTLIDKQAQTAGHAVTKGYLLVGDAATAQQYAHAFAAEVTALQHAQNPSKVCALYDVHASVLLTKSLDTIIKEVEEWSDANQTVLVINEIDWLFTLDKPDTKVTSDLINNLAKVARPTSKKDIIVIATASPAGAAKLNPALLTPNGLGIKIVVQPLTDLQRVEIIKKETTTKGLTCSDEFVTQFATQLKEYQAPALTLLVNQAFSLAQANQEMFGEKHLTASLELQSK